ncbi:IPT/TIG domain-containing protein [Pontibacter locisalis]|uniref:IPT/TIG domain-containing protein n=1 Tax=Pontibacter locisalis TaxID=1719035 RepID=A0ABW5IH59_9BACT
MRTALLILILSFSFITPSLAQSTSYTIDYVKGNVLNNAQDVIVGNDGLLYVADSYSTRAFDPAGNFKGEFHLKGIYNDWYSHNTLTRDSNGNIYVISFDGIIHKISPDDEVLFTFGEKSASGIRDAPKGIVVDQVGNIFVADTKNHRILKYDQQGIIILSFGSFGLEPGQLNTPTQLAVDNDGNLYVADTENHRIQVFDQQGAFIREIGASVDPAMQFYPSDVSVDSYGNVYVADIAHHKILVYSSAGKLIKSFGSKGTGNGQFTTPSFSIAVDASGFIYVSDNSNRSRIQKFNAAGDYILSFGSIITENNLLSSPFTVESDPVGNYFVADNSNKKISKFDKYGNHLLSFGGKADADGKFNFIIFDMELDKQGNLYVFEPNIKGSVQKFNSRGEFVTRFAPTSITTSVEPTPEPIPEPTPELPAKPHYILLDHEGYIYLVEKTFIYKYDPSGKLIKRLTLINNETGNPIELTKAALYGPTGIKIDNKGQIHVSHKRDIKKYDLNGNYIGDFIPQEHPYGLNANDIDFDSDNNMYVANWSYIKKFNSETGELLAVSSYHSFLLHILGSKISVNSSGTKVYVTSALNTLSCFTNGLTQEYSSPVKYITGSIYQDLNENCNKESIESTLTGIIVEATPGPYYGISDRNGNYSIEVDSGTYTLSQVLPKAISGKNVDQCEPELQVSFEHQENTSFNNNFGNKITLSPYLTISLSSNRRRRCFENNTIIKYANEGYATAVDAKVHLQLPGQVELLSADKPFVRQPDGTYIFKVGDLIAGKTGTITIKDIVVCGDESIRGLTVCTKAWITPLNVQPPPTATITVTGNCNSGTGYVRFVLKNVGKNSMETRKPFRLYLDGQLATIETFKLITGDSLVLWIPTGGKTARLEADQPEGNGDNKVVSKTVEDCHTSNSSAVAASRGFVNVLSSDDEEPEVAEECLPIIDSYDPNDKLVSPIGLTEENYTPTGIELKYKIRFQNTGTDVAYRVVVVDTLSEHLDLSTLQLGAASHSYRYNVSGMGKPVITWTFDNIMLPDSTSDEPGSHGFIQFTIKPKAGLPEKTAVENFADIFFDFNSPVRTNTTVNHIYDMPPVVNEEVRLEAEQIIASPAITDFSPEAGRFGAEVTLTGKNFGPTPEQNKVYFNGMLATVRYASATQLRVLVPESSSSGAVKVITPDGGIQTTKDFEVYQPPVISSFTPGEGVPSATVTLEGMNLTADWLQRIKLGSEICEIISAKGTSAVVRVPQLALTGSFEIITKGGQTSSTEQFVVWHQPVITSLSNYLDKVGATVVISGENYAADAARNIVHFGTVQAQVLEASASHLKVLVPAGATTATVSVETPGGKISSSRLFEVIPAPVLVSFTPERGPIGTEVSLIGENFLALGMQDTIYINGDKAQVLNATTEKVTIRIPRGATTGKIKIAGIGGFALSATDFVVEELRAEEAIEVFPNPTTGHFTIRFAHADFDIQSVEIYTSVGRVIHTVPVASPRPEKLEVDITKAKPGMYLLRIQTDRGTVVKKLNLI